jgi:hypothetical protein
MGGRFALILEFAMFDACVVLACVVARHSLRPE